MGGWERDWYKDTGGWNSVVDWTDRHQSVTNRKYVIVDKMLRLLSAASGMKEADELEQAIREYEEHDGGQGPLARELTREE